MQIKRIDHILLLGSCCEVILIIFALFVCSVCDFFLIFNALNINIRRFREENPWASLGTRIPDSAIPFLIVNKNSHFNGH